MADSEKFLITRPQHDIVTQYLFSWSKDLIKDAKDSGLEVLKLDGEEATRQEFESYIEVKDPKLMILNGHGTKQSVAGHNNSPILIMDENEEKTKDKILYVRACGSASELGRNCTEEKGAKAFIGYEDDFVLIRDTRESAGLDLS